MSISTPGSNPAPSNVKRCCPFLPGPRGFQRLPRIPDVWIRSAVSFRVAAPSGFSTFQPRGVASASASHRVFSPLRQFRFVRLRSDVHVRAPASAGFGDPLDAFLSAMNLPGVFHPGPPVGFSPSRLFPPSDRPVLSVRACPPDAWTRSFELFRVCIFRASPRRKPVTRRSPFGIAGPRPSWGSRLFKVSTGRSPRLSARTLSGFRARGLPLSGNPRTPATQGNQSAGRTGSRRSQTFLRFLDLVAVVFGSNVRPSLAMGSLGTSNRVSTIPRVPFGSFRSSWPLFRAAPKRRRFGCQTRQ